MLIVSYAVGLLFTLKTHSYIFKNDENSEEEHEGPAWSPKVAVAMLAISIGLFALISEKAIEVPAPCVAKHRKLTSMLQTIEPTLEALGINQNFAGVTIIALVPSSAEVTPLYFPVHF